MTLECDWGVLHCFRVYLMAHVSNYNHKSNGTLGFWAFRLCLQAQFRFQ